MNEKISAIVRLAITLAASIAAMLGYAFDAEAAITVATTAIALVAAVWAWWKNNNVTDAAIAAQGYLDELKEEGDD